jgi:hypothetical protein
MFKLPIDIIRHIWEFDNTYHDKYKLVMKKINHLSINEILSSYILHKYIKLKNIDIKWIRENEYIITEYDKRDKTRLLHITIKKEEMNMKKLVEFKSIDKYTLTEKTIEYYIHHIRGFLLLNQVKNR